MKENKTPQPSVCSLSNLQGLFSVPGHRHREMYEKEFDHDDVDYDFFDDT